MSKKLLLSAFVLLWLFAFYWTWPVKPKLVGHLLSYFLPFCCYSHCPCVRETNHCWPQPQIDWSWTRVRYGLFSVLYQWWYTRSKSLCTTRYPMCPCCFCRYWKLCYPFADLHEQVLHNFIFQFANFPQLQCSIVTNTNGLVQFHVLMGPGDFQIFKDIISETESQATIEVVEFNDARVKPLIRVVWTNTFCFIPFFMSTLLIFLCSGKVFTQRYITILLIMQDFTYPTCFLKLTKWSI